MMLEALNSLSRDESGRTLCRDFPEGSKTSLAQFQMDLALLRAEVEVTSVDSFLLYCESPYNFLLGFMALLGLNRKVVICASAKPVWLEQISDGFGAVLSDANINLSGKESLDFSSLKEKTNPIPWHPEFSGKENVVFFTSGSTGQPKAINKTLIALTNEIKTLEQTFKLAENNAIFFSSVSHLHIYGLLFKILWPALTGNSWINQQVEYPEQLGLITHDLEQLVFISSPAFLSRLDLNLPELKFSKTFSSGGPLSFSAANDARKLFGSSPTEVYGSTETGGIAFRQQDVENPPWQPFPGINLDNVEGEARLSSPHIPEQDSVALDDRLVFFADGRFVLKGRKDRVVKIEEKRISLTEIEIYLSGLDEIEKAVAFLLKGDRDVVGCVVVLNKAGEDILSRKNLRYLITNWKGEMARRFERITIPKKWRVVPEIPLNTQSKIDMEYLLAQF